MDIRSTLIELCEAAAKIINIETKLCRTALGGGVGHAHCAGASTMARAQPASR
jgi:hypothetical protein